jgi:RHS repeat-associated protein
MVVWACPRPVNASCWGRGEKIGANAPGVGGHVTLNRDVHWGVALVVFHLLNTGSTSLSKTATQVQPSTRRIQVMLTAAKEEMFSRPMVWTKECALPLAATGVYAKTRVWGSEPENLHCFSATAPVKIELRWGCEESSGKTAAGSGVAFKYDPFGRRIYKQSANATSIFVYDGANLIETVSATGGTVARYTQGQSIDEPLAMQRGTATDYYEADGLGSITSLTDPTGAVAQGYTYDSFGNQTNSTGTLRNYFRYTAREFDTETTLYFYRARYYDPSPGRFVSEDPISFSGGINFYSYAFNNPVGLKDPMGNNPGTVALPWWGWWGWAEGGSVWLGNVIGGGIAVGLQLTLFAPSVARDEDMLPSCGKNSGRQTKCVPLGYDKQLLGCRYICDDGTMWFQAGSCVNPLYKPWGGGFPKYPPIPKP